MVEGFLQDSERLSVKISALTNERMVIAVLALYVKDEGQYGAI
jgi:hypothetical protein